MKINIKEILLESGALLVTPGILPLIKNRSYHNSINSAQNLKELKELKSLAKDDNNVNFVGSGMRNGALVGAGLGTFISAEDNFDNPETIPLMAGVGTIGGLAGSAIAYPFKKNLKETYRNKEIKLGIKNEN